MGAPGAGVAVAPDRRRLGLVGGGRRRPVPRGGRHVRPGALGGVVRRHRPGGPAVSGGDPDRPPEPPPQTWSDWIAPGSVADRLRLEKLVHDADCGTDGETLFVGEAIERSRSIDAQCVLSLSVEAARVLGLPDPWSLEHLWDIAREPPEDPVRCRAHERVPQLFVAVGVRCWRAATSLTPSHWSRSVPSARATSAGWTPATPTRPPRPGSRRLRSRVPPGSGATARGRCGKPPTSRDGDTPPPWPSSP